MDDIARQNLKYWNKVIAEGSMYTTPWYELKKEAIKAFADGKIEVLPEPYSYIYPQRIFKGIEGKDVLCLASGGGQQSVVFGLLGAGLTCLDLTEAQLESDRKAAMHHGYEIKTIQGDMRNLSVLADDSFDLVYQAVSINFVPDVRQVYAEVARVLKLDALYRVGCTNPATEMVDEKSWDGKGYRIMTPYTRGHIEDDDEISAEFRHLFSDLFNGLLETGFIIKGVWEDPRHIYHNKNHAPGSYEHMLGFVQQHFAIVAQKASILN